jgi:hypothetical protein
MELAFGAGQVLAGCGQFLSQRCHIAHETGAVLDVLAKLVEVREMALDTLDGGLQSGAVRQCTQQVQAVGDDLASRSTSTTPTHWCCGLSLHCGHLTRQPSV